MAVDRSPCARLGHIRTALESRRVPGAFNPKSSRLAGRNCLGRAFSVDEHGSLEAQSHSFSRLEEGRALDRMAHDILPELSVLHPRFEEPFPGPGRKHHHICVCSGHRGQGLAFVSYIRLAFNSHAPVARLCHRNPSRVKIIVDRPL